MSQFVLDILDSQLQLWQGTSRVLSEPGIANWDGAQYLFGTAASERARRHPHTTLSRYWQSLDTNSNKSQAGNARHHADLAHAQLLDIFTQSGRAFNELALTLPANMTREQIALLLGIVESCPFSANAIIHRSAALASTTQRADWHLELQWHQALLVPLSYREGRVHAGAEKLLPGCGLLALQDALARRIARDFVSQTRFDPLRTASAEQSLHNQLPQLLLTLVEQGEAVLNIEGHRAGIHADSLAEACTDIFADIQYAADAGEQRVLIEPITAVVPGIFNALPNTLVCEEDAIARAMLAQNEAVNDGEYLQFQRSWPRSVLDEPAASKPEKSALGQNPTHALRGDEAWPLAQLSRRFSAPWSLVNTQEQWFLRGDKLPQVNGRPADGNAPLSIGDRLDAGAQQQFTLIKVN